MDNDAGGIEHRRQAGWRQRTEAMDDGGCDVVGGQLAVPGIVLRLGDDASNDMRCQSVCGRLYFGQGKQTVGRGNRAARICGHQTVLSSHIGRFWRRRTGIEPARPSYLVSSVLKTA